MYMNALPTHRNYWYSYSWVNHKLIISYHVVELTSEDSSPDHKNQKIAGFVIQACVDGHPMGKFVSLETDTGWKPAHCLEPQVY